MVLIARLVYRNFSFFIVNEGSSLETTCVKNVFPCLYITFGVMTLLWVHSSI